MSSRCLNRRVRVGALRRPVRPGSAVEVCRHGAVGWEDACLGACLDRHVRDSKALVDRERLGTRADELEHGIRPAADTDLRENGEDHVLARDEATRTASELDLDRRWHRLPERAKRKARGDVRRPEPRPERAEGAIRAGVGVAAGDDRPGHDPTLLAEERVLDAAAALAVVGDALLLRPSLQACLELGRLHVLRRHEVVGDHDDPGGVEHALGAHLLHRAKRDRTGDIVRHHDVAAHGDDVTGPDVVGVAVREQDLLNECVRQPTPPVPRDTRRATRRHRT